MSTVDLSTDQALIDGLETITLDMAIGPVSRAYTDAYRLPETLGEGDPSEGGYLARMTEWHLPTTGAAIDPKPGDTITDAATIVWVIQDVRAPKVFDGSGDYWGLRCRELAITADTALRDLVTLHPTRRTLRPDGSKISSHIAADGDFVDVPAKIQLRPSTADLLAGQERFIEVYDVYVERDIGQVNAGDVLKDGDGKVYRIISYRNRELIDDLSTLVCEAKPSIRV